MTPKERHKLHLFIATKVMGWRQLDYFSNLKDGCCFDDGVNVHFMVRFCLSIFCPTRDYAQALQVLEKCGERCTPIRVMGFDDGNESNIVQWVVDFGKLGEKGYKHGEAPTLPEAICKLARALFS